MKKYTKTYSEKLILFLLSMIILFCVSCSMNAYASDNHGEVIKSGNCGANGNNVTFKLYKDGTLIISGKGEMANYRDEEPPYVKYVKNEQGSVIGEKRIKSVIIKEGVTTVSEDAFCQCNSLEKVVFPKSLIKIDEWAFYLCGKLSNVVLPQNIESIGEIAFAGCNLKKINIPKTLTDLHGRAFEDNPIVSFSVDKDHPYFSSDNNGIIFSKDKTRLIKYPYGRTNKHYTIPGNVNSISAYAFSNNYYIETIELPSNLSFLGAYAFSSCTNLINVTIPGSLNSIGNQAFLFCNNLVEVVVENGVKNIGQGAFSYCSNLYEIKLPKSILYIGNDAFGFCKNLEKIYLSDNVSYISTDAFYYCENLQSIEVSNKNESFSTESGILYNKDKTEVLYIPVKISGEISIPKTLEKIDWKTFNDCKNITSFNVDKDNKKIKSIDGIIYSADGKKLILCPKSKCGEVKIYKKTKKINNYAFYGCTKITGVDIPKSVKTIGDNAFDFCLEIDRIEIPDSVTKIGKAAFVGCESLKYVKLSKNAISFEGTFEDCNLMFIAFPEGTIKIGKACCSFNDNLKSIYIPESVKIIEARAMQCGTDSGLNIYYGGTKKQWKNIKINGNNESLPYAKMHYNTDIENVYVLKGKCGENLKYKLDFFGNLTISGKGEMKEFGHRLAPWYEYPVFNLILDEGITSFSNNAFLNTRIDKFVSPESLEKIGMWCFDECYDLKSVRLSKNITFIGDEAFGDCGALCSIIVDKKNKNFYSQNNCLINRDSKTLIKGCTDSVIPNDIKIIGESAFSNTNMTDIILPKSVCEIGWSAFANCNNLKNIIIPEGVKTIPVHCFERCRELESVVIPSSVTYIDEGAFYDCEKFSKVYYQGKAERWKKIEINHKNEKRQVVGLTAVYGENGWEYTDAPIENKNAMIDNAKVISICSCYEPTFVVTKASINKTGKIETKCKVCGHVSETVEIPKVQSVNLSVSKIEYSGKNITPIVIVKDSVGKTLKKGTDFTLSYPKNSESIGEYTVTIKFIGNYGGTKKLTFEIVPAKVSLSIVTAENKQLTVVWNAISDATGYEVQYSTSKKFTKKTTKTATIKKPKTTKKTIKSLKKGKKYYVRVRTYKVVNGKKIYSVWCSMKSVKVK